MDVGDGLTLQKADMDGKNSSKIFLLHDMNKARNSKLQKSHLTSRKRYPPRFQSEKSKSIGEFGVNNGRKGKEKKQHNSLGANGSEKFLPRSMPKDTSTSDDKVSAKSKQNLQNILNKNEPNSGTMNVDAQYVTLTQGQLSSILDLVKENRNIHMEAKGQFANTASQTADDLANSQEHNDTNDDSKSDASKVVDEQVNETKPVESIALVSEHLSHVMSTPGTIHGFGVRDQEQLILERNKQKWLQELNAQVESRKVAVKKHPKISKPQSAVRSSLLRNKPSLSDDDKNTKRKDDQKRWKEELDQQISDKNQENLRSSSFGGQIDHSAWTKHFDTFVPVSSKPVEEKKQPEKNSKLDHVNHLRSMTSLLDPAEIDAIGLRRLKQEEHRRVISEQIDEKRKIKEAENKARRDKEEIEERRLAADRLKLQVQFEKEKELQLVKEEKREQQTLKLYQQIKAAEERAQKDKMERMKQNFPALRQENLNQNKTEHLPSKKKTAVPACSDADHSEPSSGHLIDSVTEQNKEPSLSMLADSTDGKIKLEISLLQSPRNFQCTEAAVQTDKLMLNPYSSGGKESVGKVATPHRENLKNPGPGKHNPKHNRKDRDILQLSEKKEKPKWGVGQVRKQYVPASKRYPNGGQHIHQRVKGEATNQSVNSNLHKLKTSTKFETSITFSPMASHDQSLQEFDRMQSAMSVTTDEAKYEASKHSSSSPVPDTVAFVEYLRSDSILDGNDQKAKETFADANSNELQDVDKKKVADRRAPNPLPITKDPLLDGNVKQRQRHDTILHEISILRQGLLLKQREVASYPVTVGNLMTSNLTEKNNEPVV